MKGKISFNPDAIHHIYTISEDGGIIFYSEFDYLVFFTILCTSARRYGVTIVSVCIMRNHVHLGVIAEDKVIITRFMKSIIGTFVKEYNSRNGSYTLKFKRSFGIAGKNGEKEKRTCIIYIANNGVDKKGSSSTIEYKWNFLKYIDNPHPYSEKVVIRRMTPRMSSAMSAIRTCFNNGHIIRYSFFENVYRNLSVLEKKQIKDYIISTYNVIDYKAAIALFNTAEKMLTAMEASTGKEFDVGEEYVYEDYRHYDSLVSIACKNKLIGPSGQLVCTRESIAAVSRLFHYNTYASELEINRFLHCF